MEIEVTSVIYKTSKLKWNIYISIIVLIVGANFSIYNTSFFEPFDEKIVLASLIDFILVIPILTYFLIIRKNYSLKAIGIPILAGYAATYYIIPQEYLQSFNKLTWAIIAVEGLIFTIELFLLYKMLRNLPKLIKDFNVRSQKGYYFIENMNECLKSIFPSSALSKIWATESSIYYYALFCFRKKRNTHPENYKFSYHKKTSVIALNIMLIHAVVIETVGVHYLLHTINPIISCITLILNIYTVLLFIAEIQATRLTPIQIRNKELIIQIGIMKRINIPLENISKFDYYYGPEKFSKQELEQIFDARVNDFFQEKPMFDIYLNDALTANLLYGFTKKVNRIVLSVDEPDRFYQTISQSLQDYKTTTL
jgi:membrane protein YdbS with pleckstrin-like domain